MSRHGRPFLEKDETRIKRNVDRRNDEFLRRKLYRRAAERLRTAAEWAEKRDATWAQVCTESGLVLIRAANSL
jgi:hypothetical protein